MQVCWWKCTADFLLRGVLCPSSFCALDNGSPSSWLFSDNWVHFSSLAVFSYAKNTWRCVVNTCWPLPIGRTPLLMLNTSSLARNTRGSNPMREIGSFPLATSVHGSGSPHLLPSPPCTIRNQLCYCRSCNRVVLLRAVSCPHFHSPCFLLAYCWRVESSVMLYGFLLLCHTLESLHASEVIKNSLASRGSL